MLSICPTWFTIRPRGARALIGMFAVVCLVQSLFSSISMVSAQVAGSPAAWFILGSGFADGIPHQIVRTADDRLFLFAGAGQYSNQISATWTGSAGLPAGASSFTSSASQAASANVLTIDAAYDGGTTVHVLAPTQDGVLHDYPFDTSAGRFRTGLTLASGDPTVTGDYIGSGGVAGMFDRAGTLHVAYWSSGNHITYVAYTYNSTTNSLTAVSGPTQVDTAGAAVHPSLAISPKDGNVSVAWVSQAASPAQILSRTRSSAGAWGGIQTASTAAVWTSTNAGIDVDQGPSMVIAASGIRYLTYIENYDTAGNYGHVHVVTDTGSGWVDQAVPSTYSHDPVVALTNSGAVTLIGHGHPLNAACKSTTVMCTKPLNSDGSWGTSQAFATPSGSNSFDSSASVKWSVVGWNRPETVEFVFFQAINGNYNTTQLIYGRLATTGSSSVSPTPTNTPTSAAATATPTATAAPATATPLATPSAGQSASPSFQSGFESGNFSDWSGTVLNGSGEVAQVTTQAAETGTYGAHFSNGAAAQNGAGQAWKGLSLNTTAAAALTLQSSVLVNSVTGHGTLVLLELHRNSPVYNGIARFQYAHGAWQFSVRGLDGNWISSAPIAFTLGAWHQVQFTYDGSGSQPVLRGSVDGGAPVTVTDTSTGTLYLPDSIYVGARETNWRATGDVWLDNISVAEPPLGGTRPSPTSTPTASPTATRVAATATAASTATATPGTTSGPPMFQSGFETGSFSDWSGTAMNGTNEAAQVTTQAAQTGKYGAHFTNGTAAQNGTGQAWKALGPANTPVLTLQAAVFVNSVTGDGRLVLLELHRGGPLYNGVARFQYGNGAWQFSMRGLNGNWLNTPAVAFSVGMWHQVQLTYDASGPQPVLRGRVDGGAPVSVTDSTTGTLYLPDSIYVGVREVAWTATADTWMDNVSVTSGSGGASASTPTSTPTNAPSTATPTRTVVAAATATSTSTPIGSTTTDWTQDQHDAQHTGATTEEPNETWNLQWTWNGADSSGGSGGHFYNAPAEARTVVGGGQLYAPAGSQGLYALNISSGQQAWHIATPAFGAAPAYDPTTRAVFAGGADGTLYKLSASNGQILGTYKAGSPLNKAVLLVGGSAYVVANNGQLHRVNTTSMSAVWVYTPPIAPIAKPISGYGLGSTPAAYSASRDELVYATADLYVHSVNNKDGSLKWRVLPTPVQPGLTSENPNAGNTFDRSWPVIAEKHGLVFLRLQVGIAKASDYPSTGGIYPNTNAAVRTYLQTHADHQTLFALSLDTGSAPFVPAVGVGYTEGFANGAADAQMGSVPAVKVWPNGDEVVYIHFRNGQSNPPDYRWDGHLGEMVLDSTTVSGLAPGDLRFMQFDRYNGTVGYSGGAGYTYLIDEQEPLSIAGSTIFHAHWGASESSAITDRSPTRGLTYGNPITMSRHPTMVRQMQACSDFQPSTHRTSCGLTMYNDGRFWEGPGFWEYWNTVAPPGSPSSTSYSAGVLPRYTYVSNGLIVVEGNGGELYVLRHS